MATDSTKGNPAKIAYRLKDAAHVVGASQDVITKMIANGQIKARRICPTGTGQRYMTFIPRSELVRVFGIGE